MEHSGLVPDVRAALRDCVLDAMPLWDATPAMDHWRVVRPTGEHGTEAFVERRKGPHSSSMFALQLPERSSFQRLSEAASTKQPELGRYVGTATGGMSISLAQMVAHLVSQADRSKLRSEALEQLLDELELLLRTRHVRVQVLAPLLNVEAPTLTAPVAMCRGVALRALNADEQQELMSHDALSPKPRPRFAHPSVALEKIVPSVLFLGPDERGDQVKEFEKLRQAREDIRFAHAVLHAFKEGGAWAGPIINRSLTSALPTVENEEITGIDTRHRAFHLTGDEVASLSAFTAPFDGACRPELILATGRLRDAELRTSSVDSLVDAFVGIEALLNPFADGELSFRVSMNYSTLGAAQDRLQRFRTLRDLYKVRNGVVHGSTATKTYRVGGKPTPAAEAAKMARQVLRHIVHEFCRDALLRSDEALDGAFWEGRYFS